MTNWRELDLNTNEGLDALQWIIAERYGYTDIHESERDTCDADHVAHLGIYTLPCLRGNKGEQKNVFIPDFPRDLNAAALLHHEDAWLDLSIGDQDVSAIFYKYGTGTMGYDYGGGLTPQKTMSHTSEAIARCRAWLEYGDAATGDTGAIDLK